MKDRKCIQISLCFLLTAALCLEAIVLKRESSLLPGKPWAEARRLCRSEGVDLMPFDIVKELKVTKELLSSGVVEVWIGNYKDSHGQMKTINIYLAGLCLHDNLELVKEKKTWEEALQHCRDKSKCDEKGVCEYNSSLLTLKSPADYSYVRARISAADTDEVWTGLRFLGGHWFWVDGEELKDEGELPRCPSQWKHCGTLSKTNKSQWITRDCSEKRNFICAYVYHEQFL